MIDKVLQEVRLERERQDKKWGIQNHNFFVWMAILGEEVGESNKALLENDLPGLRTELIQVAAVAVAAIENMDRIHK